MTHSHYARDETMDRSVQSANRSFEYQMVPYTTPESGCSDYYITAAWAWAILKYAFVCYLGKTLWILLLFYALSMGYYLYNLYMNPICNVKTLADVGFGHIKGKHRLNDIRTAQMLRDKGNELKIPPPYPNGWFAVAESRDLKNGKVQPVDVLGYNLCVYRGEDGRVRVVDAYCPHVGANLAVGGKVIGECIQCPFHEWSFGEGGICTAQRGSTIGTRRIAIEPWRCVEADGAVWIWHDAEGREPLWPIQNAQQCKRWGLRGSNEYKVSTHIREILEKNADVVRLKAVHGTYFSILTEKYPFLKKFIGHDVWTTDWISNGNHTSIITINHQYKIMGRIAFEITLKMKQIGPGHVRMLMKTPIGPYFISQTVTPESRHMQRVTSKVFSPYYNAFAAWFIIDAEGKMLERYIQIWNSKRFVVRPVYTKADKCLRAFRSWYGQFYSVSSTTYVDAAQNNLDW